MCCMWYHACTDINLFFSLPRRRLWEILQYTNRLNVRGVCLASIIFIGCHILFTFSIPSTPSCSRRNTSRATAIRNSEAPPATAEFCFHLLFSADHKSGVAARIPPQQLLHLLDLSWSLFYDTISIKRRRSEAEAVPSKSLHGKLCLSTAALASCAASRVDIIPIKTLKKWIK